MLRHAVLGVAGSLLLVTAAEARDQVRAVGSSTVYPFVTAAAENFGKGGKFKTPIVESTGTGGGFKLFCAGVGHDTPDISNASRPITQSEKDMCKQNGVSDIAELMIGYDGIVFANSVKAKPFALSKRDVFLALAREIPKDGKLVKNPYTQWNEVNPKLPAQKIEVYGPPPTSGTRDAFVELVMEKTCESFPEFKAAYADEKARKGACKMLREDGKFVEAGEDDNLIIQKLEANANAVGIFGYSFLAENKQKIQAASVDGVAPDFKNIENGSYGVSRSLFIYVKNQHIGQVPGLAEFAREVVSPGAIGANGYLIDKGLLPLHAEAMKATQSAAAKLPGAKPAATAPAR